MVMNLVYSFIVELVRFVSFWLSNCFPMWNASRHYVFALPKGWLSVTNFCCFYKMQKTFPVCWDPSQLPACTRPQICFLDSCSLRSSRFFGSCVRPAEALFSVENSPFCWDLKLSRSASGRNVKTSCRHVCALLSKKSPSKGLFSTPKNCCSRLTSNHLVFIAQQLTHIIILLHEGNCQGSQHTGQVFYISRKHCNFFVIVQLRLSVLLKGLLPNVQPLTRLCSLPAKRTVFNPK